MTSIPMYRLSPETGDMFGYGMDRPPMPPPPATPRFTMADLREQGLVEEKPSRAKARKTDPQPSQDAAATMNQGGKVNDREMAVLLCLHDHGPGTWDEIAAKTGLRPGTISPRFKPLREKGYIYDTGETAPGASGANQTIWALTRAGIALFAKEGDDEQLAIEL